MNRTQVIQVLKTYIYFLYVIAVVLVSNSNVLNLLCMDLDLDPNLSWIQNRFHTCFIVNERIWLLSWWDTHSQITTLVFFFSLVKVIFLSNVSLMPPQTLYDSYPLQLLKLDPFYGFTNAL